MSFQPGDWVCQTWKDSDFNKAGNLTPQIYFRFERELSPGVAVLTKPPDDEYEYVCRTSGLRAATDEERAG
jgi:hypothetical protein